jgi:hypothetical protein
MRKSAFIIIDSIHVTAVPGIHIDVAGRDAAILSLEENIPVILTFNNIQHRCDPKNLGLYIIPETEFQKKV